MTNATFNLTQLEFGRLPGLDDVVITMNSSDLYGINNVSFAGPDAPWNKKYFGVGRGASERAQRS
jgi:hypothetical protein